MESLLGLLDHHIGVSCPLEILRDVGPQDFKRGDSHTGVIDVQCGRGVIALPVVHDQLLNFVDVRQQVFFSTPLCQPLHLISVGGLIAISYESHQGGVICEFSYCVGVIGGGAVIGVYGVEEWAQHTALWGASAEHEGG